MNYAVELMTNTDRTISEIAFACGFDTIRTFNKIFKSTFGDVPTAVRNRIRYGYTDGIAASFSDTSDFTGNVDISVQKEGTKSYISALCNDTDHKIWTTISVKKQFRPGKSYTAHFRVRFLSAADKNKLCINAAYLQNGKLANHVCHADVISENDGFINYSASFAVPENYIPSAQDLFSVFSNPYEDKGVSFELHDFMLTEN